MADEKQVKTGGDADKAQTAQDKAVSYDEGTLRALRDDAGLNQSSGHESDVLQWEQSPDGQRFLDEEGDRLKFVKAEAKALADEANDDCVDPASVKYVEAVKQ